MNQPITPYLLYEDVEAAVDFFRRAFGWPEVGERMTGDDARVSHAAVEAHNGVIMLGRPGPDYRNPKRLGTATQSLYIRVPDVDSHCARAVEAGARITEAPNDTFYGDRRYGLEDAEGHLWYFASRLSTGLLQLDAVGQIAIRVRDLDRAIAIYRDNLGLQFLFRAPPALAFFDCGGVRLMLSPAEAGEFDHAASILYFRVGDIAAAYARLAAHGVVFRNGPHKVADLGERVLWLADFEDGEGNVFALMSEIPGNA